MSAACSHEIRITDKARTEIPVVGQYWDRKSCYGPDTHKERYSCSTKNVGRVYRRSHLLTSRKPVVPSSYPRSERQAVHAVTLKHERSAYADYSAADDCGCSQNASGDACW